MNPCASRCTLLNASLYPLTPALWLDSFDLQLLHQIPKQLGTKSDRPFWGVHVCNSDSAYDNIPMIPPKTLGRGGIPQEPACMCTYLCVRQFEGD